MNEEFSVNSNQIVTPISESVRIQYVQIRVYILIIWSGICTGTTQRLPTVVLAKGIHYSNTILWMLVVPLPAIPV